MKRLVFVVLGLGLTGCASIQKPIPNDPNFAPVLPEAQTTPVLISGSLFSNYSQNLYSDIKAHRVGDIITVNLSEATSASKTAKTEIEKTTDVSLLEPTLFGSQLSINGKGLGAAINSANEFAGEADADQSNSLKGSISVHVVEVLPNGNLRVRGEKWITLNTGDEFIRLSGLIRAEDISPTNAISSTRIANARIEYSGTGSFADSQEQGWLAKMFNSSYWPF